MLDIFAAVRSLVQASEEFEAVDRVEKVTFYFFVFVGACREASG
ncbi:MAG: hypothetical protein ACLQPD_10795 [Desulfomonilaceae bacterium]